MNLLQLRPNNLKDFLGKNELKKNLRIYIDKAKQKNHVLDHCLFYGPAGVGKTSLANIISNEMKVSIKVLQGPEIQEKNDLLNILYSIKEKDIVFIDEIHAVNPNSFEMFYSVMEDFKVNINVGKEFNTKITSINVPKFTLIGATTKLGNLPNPFEERFGIICHIDEYSADELFLILKSICEKISVNLDEEILKEIAKKSKGIPRLAKRILARFIDHYETKKENTDLILKKIGIFNLGLNTTDLNYLMCLASKNALGIKSLTQVLNVDEKTIINKIEPFLIKNNLIEKTSFGRKLTNFGKDYLEKI